jgi:O-methyltransferase
MRKEAPVHAAEPKPSSEGGLRFYLGSSQRILPLAPSIADCPNRLPTRAAARAAPARPRREYQIGEDRSRMIVSECRPLSAKSLYLDLLKRCLTRTLFPEQYQRIGSTRFPHRVIYSLLRAFLGRSFDVVRLRDYDEKTREWGLDWPAEAETMIGLKRLDSLQRCAVDVIENKIPGDFIETGVWRGGACIFMRGILKAYEITDRIIWVADSFQGLPKPDPSRYPADANDSLWTKSFLAVPLDAVKCNFQRYGMLDEQVKFIPGLFRVSLPAAPIERLAILRLDGDMYESTMDSLRSLYPKLSVGGYVIIDDYFLDSCRKAVHDFRAFYAISDKIFQVEDGLSAYWRKCPPPLPPHSVGDYGRGT